MEMSLKQLHKWLCGQRAKEQEMDAGCWKIQGGTVIAEAAETFADRNETKEFRVSCLSARQESPVNTGLSINIGWVSCYVSAIHFGIF